jgi:tetratricopeptide (TPR) repeat protein
MNTAGNYNVLDICANCGKGEEASISLKACAACKLVKYCSRDCQIAHRPQHKKECKKRAKELHDEKLFRQPPPMEDCPICMIRLPSLRMGSVYMVCCGKVICNGCVYAPVYDDKGNKVTEKTCPFCRLPDPKTDGEVVKRNKKRVDMNDPIAILNFGCMYRDGTYGMQQDGIEALELWHRAAELGYAAAYYNIGIAYHFGYGNIEKDEKKAKHYFEVAAMRGDSEQARNNLGCIEGNAGNADRALKHFMIAAKDGSSNSLKSIKLMYKNGDATKDEYTKALRSYQAYLDEIRSDQRDKAAAAFNKYKYYESAV